MKSNKTTKEIMPELEEDFLDVSSVLDTSLPDPSMVEFYRRIKKREILWNSDIDDSTIDVALYIKKWNEEDKGIKTEGRKPIKIFINTDGGSADAVLHVIDMIKLSKTPVYTIGMSKVFSAGALLLMAGKRRLIFPNTTCLIHDGSFGAMASTSKMLDNLEFTKESEKRMKAYILSNTKITEDVYDKNYRCDWYIFSEEMIEFGIADEIITDIDVIL